ncbi:MAG: SusC/RagA family TonB-linked outer membrane protein [Moheibacter sp.]
MRTKFAFLSALFLLFAGQVIFAQVTGTVHDDFGPVVDAEVIVKGTDVSTYTNEKGNFTIEAKVGDILVVTDIMGSSKDFKVGKLNMGTLNLESAVELDVITLTSVFDPREAIQSGITVVGGDKLENLNPSMSVDEMLQGKASGVFSVSQSGNPGSVANINVRGAISLYGGMRPPLYVVDGSYMDEDDVNGINPNDIEEVKILKEASQTAVYGARGANGVVIIKTKTPRRGVTKMSFKSRFGFGNMIPLSNVNLMNARELLEYENNISEFGSIGIPRTPEQIDELAKYDHKWADAFYKRSYLTSQYFSVQTSGEKSATTMSVGYDYNSGTVQEYKGFERITGAVGNRTELRDWLRMGYNLNASYATQDRPRDRRNGQSPFVAAVMYKPYAPVYLHDADGNLVYDDYGDPKYNTINTGLGYPTLDEMKYTDREERSFKLFGSAFLEMDVLKNVSARTSFGATYDRRVLENFLQPRALLNGMVTPPIDPPGTKRDTSVDNLIYNWRNELTYSNSWGDHNLMITAATEYAEDKYYRLFLSSQGFPNNFQNVHSLADIILAESTSSRYLVRRFGYIGMFTYNYNNKYFLDAYFRRDGSSLTGWDNLFGNFWGGSVGWDIAREDFMISSSWVNKLSLRASYGELGDDGVLNTYGNLFAMNQPSNQYYNGQTIVFPNYNVGFKDTTWEKVRKMNFGLEFSLFNHRLRGKFDYFQDYKTNFLFNNDLSPTMGGFQETINAGEFVNRGIEVELNFDLFSKASDLQVSLFANFTNLKYEVTDLNGLDEIPVPQFEGAATLTHAIGYSPYSWKVVRYAGVDPENGDALYYDLDGNITNVYDPNNAVLLDKSPLPTIYGGFGLTASYKGFDIAADFTYTMGNYINNLTKFWLLDPVTIAANHDVSASNYWQSPGDTDVLPKPSSAGYEFGTDYFLEKGDYLRFRSLTVGYTFNSKLFENLPIDGVRIYVQAQNIYVWTKYFGNPIVGDGSTEDFSIGADNYVSGSYSAFSYPQTRTFSFGINVNF